MTQSVTFRCWLVELRRYFIQGGGLGLGRLRHSTTDFQIQTCKKATCSTCSYRETDIVVNRQHSASRSLSIQMHARFPLTNKRSRCNTEICSARDRPSIVIQSSAVFRAKELTRKSDRSHRKPLSHRSRAHRVVVPGIRNPTRRTYKMARGPGRTMHTVFQNKSNPIISKR